jgi:hypothetical protein
MILERLRISRIVVVPSVVVIISIAGCFFSLSLCLVDANETPVQFQTVQFGNGIFSIITIHGDKGESTRVHCVGIQRNVAVVHISKLFKDTLQCIPSGGKGKISDVDFDCKSITHLQDMSGKTVSKPVKRIKSRPSCTYTVYFVYSGLFQSCPLAR